jgi:transposase
MADHLTINAIAMQSQSTVAGIGIDVSGAKLDLAVRFADLSYLDDSFSNDDKGIKSLMSVLKRQETAKAAPLVIESTGNCHLQSALMIKRANYSVKLINPVLTKKFQKGSIRNAKSDAIDARRLADIACLEPNLPDFSGNLDSMAAKKATSLLAHLEKSKQQLCSSLKQFEQSAKLLKIAIDLKPTKRAIQNIEKQMAMVHHALAQKLPAAAREIVNATKGLSEKQMAVLLALVGDKQFSNRDQLVAYVGLDIALRRSGSWCGKQKLSKRGNGYARKILYQIAWGLKQHNEQFRTYFDRLRHGKKKHYNTAMVATARKFLRFMFACYFSKALSTQQA